MATKATSRGGLGTKTRTKTSSRLSRKTRAAAKKTNVKRVTEQATRKTNPKGASSRPTTARKASVRKTAAKKTTVAATRSATGALVCPECGDMFNRPQGLGAHRRRVHGIAGSSPATTARRKRHGAGRKKRASTKTTATRRSTVREALVANGGVNRDGLLRELFPSGIPASESVVRQVTAWLDDAERLVNLKVNV